jgi:ferric iron reductase protein FhuF
VTTQGSYPEATEREVREALAAAAAVGPFFVLGAEASVPGWRAAGGLYQAGPDGFLAGAVARLPGAEERVAASIAQQGYAARLWSPVLACGLLGSVVPDLASLQVSAAGWGQQAGPALTRPTGWRVAGPQALADLSYRVVVETHLEPLARTLSGSTAEGLLWGNAASALVGALGVLVAGRSGLRPPAADLATALLATGRLAGTGRLGVSGSWLGFRRRSCCLYYRLPGGGLCGDCSLTTAQAEPRGGTV